MTFSFPPGQPDSTIRTANQEYRALLGQVLRDGHYISPRGKTVLEVCNAHTFVSLVYPMTTIPSRQLGRKFQYAEAWWILTGRNDVRSIIPYSKMIAQFSDNGEYFGGSYGPKVVDQISYVVESILKDHDTRQAVMNIWRENPRVTKDTPCTLSLQFMVRKGHLHCIATMRSSDLWLGWPYDVFNFSMITRRVAEMLDNAGFSFLPGYLCINHGSLHLYEENWAQARAVKLDIREETPERETGVVPSWFPWLPNRDGGGIISVLSVLKDNPDADY